MKKALALIAAGIAAAQNPDFRNVAQEAGLTSPIPNGGSVSKQFIVETTGSGVAFIDYDNDGLADIFIASGPGSPSRMYHNEGGGKFRDVTESLGFKREGWAQESAPATTITTALPISSSPTGDRMRSIAM